MTTSRFVLRTFPGGAVATGEAYTIKLHDDDSTLDSGNTDSDGAADYQVNLSPGPHYFTGTDAVPTPDSVRVQSSKSAGSGGAYSLAELPYVLRALGHGVVPGYANEMEVTYDGSGLDLDVDTGAALALGIPAVIHTAVDGHAITSTRNATNPRACYLCLEFTGIDEAEEGKVELVDVCGTAAADPSLPTLTQTEATYQLPLASFTLPTSASTTLDDLVDLRSFVGQRNPTLSSVVRRTDPTSTATTTSTTGADVTSLTTTLTLVSGVTYDLTARAFLMAKISSAAQTVSIAPYLTATSEIASYVSSNSEDYVGMANVHTKAAVVGTGAAVSAGLRIKVSGGTATYHTGYLLVTAIPRT